MPKTLRIAPGEPSQTQRLGLDGDTYELTFRWREALRAWFLSLRDQDGEPIYLGRRLTVQSVLDAGLSDPNGPPGVFLVRGVEGYRQETVGQGLVISYVSETELAARDVDSLDLSVVPPFRAEIAGVGRVDGEVVRERIFTGGPQGVGTVDGTITIENGAYLEGTGETRLDENNISVY
jgi:hypothetical protein